MKIAFITTHIGEKRLLDLSNNFEKVKNIDYLCFTNLNKDDVINNCWEIIQINLDDFLYIKNIIKISRYFKFNIFNYLKKINKKYDFIFYFDSYLYPNFKYDWFNLSNIVKKNNFKIIQYNHKEMKSINNDIVQAYTIQKDTKKNLIDTKLYLEKLNNKISLDTLQYYENTVFGYDPNDSEIISFMNQFWNLYLECPTFRDQPLWNFLYLKNNKIPYIEKGFRINFIGKKNIYRKPDDYKNSSIIYYKYMSKFKTNLKNVNYEKHPFKHCVIDNFIKDEKILKSINDKINNLDLKEANSKFKDPNNKFEFNKYAFSKINNLDEEIFSIFKFLSSDSFIDDLEKLTGIENIIRNDCELRGAGIHIIKKNGFLELHTDFNMFDHPKYGKLDRRINLLLYMNENWKEEYKGDLLLIDKSNKKVIKKISPIFNRCVIFNTTNKSIHGHPEQLNVPNEDIKRKSIAFYYYTKNKNEDLDFEGDSFHGTIWYK